MNEMYIFVINAYIYVHECRNNLGVIIYNGIGMSMCISSNGNRPGGT